MVTRSRTVLVWLITDNLMGTSHVLKHLTKTIGSMPARQGMQVGSGARAVEVGK